MGCCGSCARGGACEGAELGELGAPQWYRVQSPGWGQIGWFYGADAEAQRLASSHLEPCEYTGAACLPFPGMGDNIPPRPRYWELWDKQTRGWRGWFHGDEKGALLLFGGNFSLVAAPTGAPLALPPVGRPTGTEPDDGEHDPPGTVVTTGSPTRGRWIAAGLAAGVGLLAFVFGR